MSKNIIYFLLFLVILLVNLYSLKPIISSGFYSDDTYNSQTKAFLKYENKSVFTYSKEISRAWIKGGRILPGFIYGYMPWVIFSNIVQYKTFMVALHIIVVIFYSFLFFKLTNSLPIFLLLFLITPVFFQFRRYHDPVTSYGFLVPLILLYLTISLIFLKQYFNKKKRVFFIISLFFYLLMLLIFYEITYIFFPIFIYLIFAHKKKVLETLKLSLPYILLSLIFISISFYVFLNRASQGSYAGSTINFDIKLIISTFIKQMSASLPLSYFFISKPLFFHISLFDYFYASILTITSFILFILHKSKKNDNSIFFIIGIFLTCLSSVPIALSKRYQLEVNWGFGYLPVYIAYFGTATILIGIIIIMINKLKKLVNKRLSILLISIFIGIIGFLNLQNNKLVVEDFNYIFKYPRDLVEISLKSKLGSNIPKNSTIISLNGLYWDNSSFYSDILKKRVKVTDLKMFVEENKKMLGNLKSVNNVKNSYVMKYQAINKDLGYVLIANVSDIYYINTDERIIFVKNPQIFIKNNTLYRYLDYRSYSILFEEKFKKNRIKLKEVSQINHNDLINFDSIRLINPDNTDELNNPNDISPIEKSYINKMNLF